MKQPKKLTIVNNTSCDAIVDFGWIFYQPEDKLFLYVYHIQPGTQRTFTFNNMSFADYPFIQTTSSTQSLLLPIPGEEGLPFGETLTLIKINKNPTAINQTGKTVGQLIPHIKRHK